MLLFLRIMPSLVLSSFFGVSSTSSSLNRGAVGFLFRFPSTNHVLSFPDTRVTKFFLTHEWKCTYHSPLSPTLGPLTLCSNSCVYHSSLQIITRVIHSFSAKPLIAVPTIPVSFQGYRNPLEPRRPTVIRRPPEFVRLRVAER